MAYRRKYLLDCEIAEAKAKNKWNGLFAWQWHPLTVGLCAAGAALLCGAIGLGVLFLWDGPPLLGPPPVPREEFRTSVVGKTRDEVTQALGPPLRTGGDFVFYSWLSRDPSTGRADKHIVVRFDVKTGRCVSVDFMPL
ncbi:MAG: hypothetical protein U0797_27390 [Gemmataceae bacterium]